MEWEYEIYNRYMYKSKVVINVLILKNLNVFFS